MKEYRLKLCKYVSVIMLTHYINWKQFIFGVTVNYEDEFFNDNTKIAKIEFNLWLFIISFHMEIYTNRKSIGRRCKF